MQAPPEPAPTVQQLLAFYLEAGVDCALMDEPVNRLADPDAAAPPRETVVREAPPSKTFLQAAAPAVPAARPDATIAPEAAISSAREAARTAPTLEALRAQSRPRRQLRHRRRDGGLRRLLRHSNRVCNRIEKNAPACGIRVLPFIQRQIELVNPDVLVTLGNPSTQALLQTREGIMRTRGKWFDYDTGTRTIRAIATFHPAYLLRSPSYKRMSWQDLRAIAKALEQTS